MKMTTKLAGIAQKKTLEINQKKTKYVQLLNKENRTKRVVHINLEGQMTIRFEEIKRTCLFENPVPQKSK